MKDVRTRVEDQTARVPSMAKGISVKSIPDAPEKAICAKHGEFEFKYVKSPFDNSAMCFSTCQKCVGERNEYIDLEVIRIEAEEKAERMKDKILSCGVSKRNMDKTFSTFNAESQDKSKAKALYSEFATSVCNGSPVKNLIVCGSVGTGKTHLASAVVNMVTHSGKTCELIKIIDLIREYKSTWSKDNNNTEKGFLDYYTNVNALIIDEVGVQFGSDTEKMIIFDIIDGRYNNMLPTMLISNLALPDVKELIGERAIDRLREDGGRVIAMSWESHRGK
jgi:DNA replication protein DnaC